MNSTNYIQNYLYGNNKRSYLSKRAGFSGITDALPSPEDMSDLEYEVMRNKANAFKDSLNNSLDTLLDYYDKEKMNPVQYFLHKNKDDLMTYSGLGAGALGLGVGGLALYLRHKDKKKKEKVMEELGLGKAASTKESLLSRIGAGIKNIMHTPLSQNEMRNILRTAKRDGGVFYDLFYKHAPKETRRQMLRNAIYENRMKMLRKLKPSLHDSIIGGSGLGVGYLLGSGSDDSE